MKHEMKKVGIFGGTFDPVHYGHLRSALELLQIIALDEVRFIPCSQPVHKDYPLAESHDRLNMLSLAVENNAPFKVDDREIRRGGSSYMIDTLKELRAEFPEQSFYLMIGSDCFVNLNGWKQWTHLLDYAHILVMMRPNRHFLPSLEVKRLLQQRQVTDISELHDSMNGGLYLQEVTALDISSTVIRAQKQAGYDIRFLLPQSVLDYIERNSLYQ